MKILRIEQRLHLFVEICKIIIQFLIDRCNVENDVFQYLNYLINNEVDEIFELILKMCAKTFQFRRQIIEST